MRRKVEKYLAEKAGVDESHIVPREDGSYDRYDVVEDIEEVLAEKRK